MAHVLLPCDLPMWNDVQRHLAPLKVAKDADQLIQVMSKVYELCSVSLEPEETQKPKRESAGSRFDELRRFLTETMLEEDRKCFYNQTLPNLVSQALCLRIVKPQPGFFYSLKRENESFELDRDFIKSLLANAFFSTFPKRTVNTHPFLQNFAFCDFFQHLHRRSHQKKLKAFFRYFKHQEDGKKKKTVCFSRKVLSGKSLPSLPAWLCSDRPLVPLLVRHDGSIHDAESNVCRAFPCTSLLGGDVLLTATSPESSLFFAFPELMCCLSFVEKLEDNEAFLAVGVTPHGIHKHHCTSGHEVNICLMDSLDLGSESERQFEDRCLLRELNKSLAAFGQKLGRANDSGDCYQRRQTPVGESSSSMEQPSSTSSRRASANHKEIELSRRRRSHEQAVNSSCAKTQRSSAKKNSSYLPLIDAGDSSSLENRRRSLPSKDSNSSNMGEFPKIAGQVPVLPPPLQSLRGSTSSSQSSSRSMKTASESSLELPPILKDVLPLQRTADDEYYTADEDSEQGSESAPKSSRRRRRRSTKDCDLSSLLLSTSALVNEKPSSGVQAEKGDSSLPKLESKDSVSSGMSGSSTRRRSSLSSKRSESPGFVLGGSCSDEDIGEFDAVDEDQGETGPAIHERLEDFRKRICRRTRRHLSRKMRSSSRSSYSLGSSTSSDMEDISEEEDTDDQPYLHQYPIIRPASSEPSLVLPNDDVVDIPPFSLGADTVVLSLGGRKVLVTSSNGHLKAYSYDGVQPNLPVPFKAKFRTRRKRHLSDGNGSSTKEQTSSLQRLSTERAQLPRNSTDSEEEQNCQNVSHLAGTMSNPLLVSGNNHTTSVEERKREICGDRCPVAVGPIRSGDAQLRALVLWLAASMAELPALIFYTGQEPQLYELSTVYRRVLAQQWTVGDLACEVLRFCRNRLSPRWRTCSSCLFEQLLSSGAVSLTSSSRSYSQYSLD